VAGKIESSITRNPYLKSGPQQSPTEMFRHYVGVAEGAGLVDRRTLSHMNELAGEFEEEGGSREYFEQVIRPWLYTLKPGRRHP
jgi:hypothetical protein